MNKIVSMAMISLFFNISFAAQAMSPMDRAFQLYQQRSNMTAARQARDIYASIIKDSHAKVEQRLEAMTRYGRLALWEGAIATEISKLSTKESAKLFDACMDLTEYISPKKIKRETPEYAYWRAACIGLWAANIKPAKAALHIGKIKEMKGLVEQGIRQFRDFDNNGFDRIHAGMLFKSKALSIMDLYHPDQALTVINQVIQKGTNIYMTYVLKAQILHHLNRGKEALTALDEGIAELNQRFTQNGIPQDLVLENMIFLENMNSYKNELTAKN